MYKISELAALFGLSRSTLLYYDRIRLLNPSERSPAGYRIYTEADRRRLDRICGYRKAGLSLDRIRSALKEDLGPDETMIRQRFNEAGREINALRKQQQLLAGMLKALPENPSILDIGCGTGAQSLWLASCLKGNITAVDNRGPFLDILQKKPGIGSSKPRLEPWKPPCLTSSFLPNPLI